MGNSGVVPASYMCRIPVGSPEWMDPRRRGRVGWDRALGVPRSASERPLVEALLRLESPRRWESGRGEVWREQPFLPKYDGHLFCRRLKVFSRR